MNTKLCKQIYFAQDQLSKTDDLMIFIQFNDESFIDDFIIEIYEFTKSVEQIHEDLLYVIIKKINVNELVDKIKTFNNDTFKCKCGQFEYNDNDYKDINGKKCCEDCKSVVYDDV